MRIEAPQRLTLQITKNPLPLAVARTLKSMGRVMGDRSRTGEGTAHHFTWVDVLAMTTLAFSNQRGIDLFQTEEERSVAFDTTVATIQAMRALDLIEVRGRGDKERAHIHPKTVSWPASF